MQMPRKAVSLPPLRRPVLRVQLTLLYSGLLVILLAVVLFATGTVVRSGQSSSEAARGGSLPALGGAAAQPGGGGRHFAIGPALIALAALAVAVPVAWWLAGRFLRPLREMTRAAREISATNLSRRLAVSGPDDELTELGRTLDDLFSRLEDSFASQRNFVANASHELRTPLAGQRTLLQVALADPGADAESLRGTCEEALRLGEQEERLIEALFTLASGERGIERRERLDLGEIAGAVLAARREEAAGRGIELRATLEAARTSGEPSLVESQVSNLVDNAIRHNSAGGRVELSTSVREGRATVVVSNTGPAIPPEDVERLFLPFRRLGEERVGRDGHGLGLAIVRAIATAHDARLTAVARPDGGLEIEVSFPPVGDGRNQPAGR